MTVKTPAALTPCPASEHNTRQTKKHTNKWSRFPPSDRPQIRTSSTLADSSFRDAT